jgi:beta-galactosidase
MEWSVNYEPGTMIARGYKNGKEVLIEKVQTTGGPAAIELASERSTIQADGEDVSAVTVKVTDSKGRLVPTAGNEITFSLEGPGKIIGVGNGDPSSHEADKFIESVSQLIIENLKTQAVHTAQDCPETGASFNDSSWPSALNQQGEYNAKTKDTLKTIVIRGTFTLPDLPENAEISLWPKSLGEEQAVYVNGVCVAKHITRDDTVQKYTLDRAILLPGKNIYAIAGTPLVKRYQYDNLNTDPGIIQVFKPSAKWKRAVFNGLAQIIVQSEKTPGNLVLTGTASGLSQGSLKIRTQPAALRPAVPAQ